MTESVYIAGPMRGYPEFNFPAFAKAAASWRAGGYEVISPAEHDVESGFDVRGLTGNEDLTGLGFSLRDALMWDLEQVASVDGIVLLPGWERSSGVRAELALAAALGKWAVEAEDALTHGPAAKFLPTTAPTASQGEVRVTSATGGQKGSKPERFDLIPAQPLRTLARLYGKGAEKYADRNWEKGYDWSLSFAALNRHLWLFWSGQDNDEETGLPHLASVAWHAFSLLEFAETHPEFDNRTATKVSDL